MSERRSLLKLLDDPRRSEVADECVRLAGKPDPELDALCADFSRRYSIPSVVVNLVPATGTRVIAGVGVPPVSRSTRGQSVCAYVSALDEPVMYEDPRGERLLKFCLSTLLLGFYAAVPLHVDGEVVGVLSAWDRKEREDGEEILSALKGAAADVEEALALRR